MNKRASKSETIIESPIITVSCPHKQDEVEKLCKGVNAFFRSAKEFFIQAALALAFVAGAAAACMLAVFLGCSLYMGARFMFSDGKHWATKDQIESLKNSIGHLYDNHLALGWRLKSVEASRSYPTNTTVTISTNEIDGWNGVIIYDSK